MANSIDNYLGVHAQALLVESRRTQLLAANLRKDIKAVRVCIAIVEPLADAWHQAYRMVGSGTEVNLSGNVRG